jgi:CheY-like chemotaxis protein
MSDRPTVLLVEHDPDLRRAAGVILRLGGYRAVCTADGPAAVTASRQCRPDLVVLDARLSDLNAWGVLTALRRDAGLARVPVVLLTASHGPAHSARVRAEGVTRCLPKPMTADGLLAAVEQALAVPAATQGG